tara:strand:- start:207 stop:716 length:510 start_codon:yes stop_codon:yes gene_type:complete
LPFLNPASCRVLCLVCNPWNILFSLAKRSVRGTKTSYYSWSLIGLGIFARSKLNNTTMPDTTPPCPQCHSEYAYPMDMLLVCPECGHEWNPNEVQDDNSLQVKDANGNLLQDGDTVVVIKNLPVKGASSPIKAGTKVKNIRLTEGDHNIDCKIDGFGAMALKSEFVKKA